MSVNASTVWCPWCGNTCVCLYMLCIYAFKYLNLHINSFTAKLSVDPSNRRSHSTKSWPSEAFGAHPYPSCHRVLVLFNALSGGIWAAIMPGSETLEHKRCYIGGLARSGWIEGRHLQHARLVHKISDDKVLDWLSCWTGLRVGLVLWQFEVALKWLRLALFGLHFSWHYTVTMWPPCWPVQS